jgi:hypothetical protein
MRALDFFMRMLVISLIFFSVYSQFLFFALLSKISYYAYDEHALKRVFVEKTREHGTNVKMNIFLVPEVAYPNKTFCCKNKRAENLTLGHL